MSYVVRIVKPTFAYKAYKSVYMHSGGTKHVYSGTKVRCSSHVFIFHSQHEQISSPSCDLCLWGLQLRVCWIFFFNEWLNDWLHCAHSASNHRVVLSWTSRSVLNRLMITDLTEKLKLGITAETRGKTRFEWRETLTNFMWTYCSPSIHYTDIFE